MGGAVVELQLHGAAQGFLPQLLIQFGIGAGLGCGSAPGELHSELGGVIAQPQLLHAFDEQSLGILHFFFQSGERLFHIFTEVQIAHLAVGGNQAVSGSGGAIGHNFHQSIPVQSQREGLAHFFIGEDAVFAVEDDHRGTGGGDHHLIHVVSALEFFHIFRSGNTQVIQRTVFKGGQLGVGIGDDVHGDLLDVKAVGIPVFVVFGQNQLAVVGPAFQSVGAAADHFVGFGAQGVAILFSDVGTVREEVGAGQQGHIGGVQLEHQGVFIGSRSAQSGHIGFTAVDGCEVFNAVVVAHMGECVVGVGLALQGSEVVLSGDLLAVGPVIFPQMEGIGQAVVGYFPGFGTGPYHFAVFNAGQRLQNVEEYIPVHHTHEAGHIQNGGLGVDEHIQVLIGVLAVLGLSLFFVAAVVHVFVWVLQGLVAPCKESDDHHQSQQKGKLPFHNDSPLFYLNQ